MKNFILVIISILFPFSAIYAQGIAIDGSAGDTANKQAVMYATIALYNSQTGKLVNGTLTDEKGNYLITGVYPGKYYIEASCIGYKKSKVSNIEVKLSTLSLTVNIIMPIDVKALEAVVVHGEKPLIELRPDRKIVNIDKTTAASGGSIAQALSVLPEISVGGNTISLKDASFTILVDGKPSGMLPEQLTQMPASLLESAEVITNPSVRYSSEGIGGIINLKMKKNLYGFNAMVQASGGSNMNGNAIATINYRTKKWNPYLTVWDRYTGSSTKGRYEAINNDSTSLLQNFSEKETRNRISTKLGVDYDINANHFLSFYWLFSYKQGSGKSEFNETYTTPLLETYSEMTRNVKDKALDNSFALNYTYTNDRITLLSLDLQYILTLTMRHPKRQERHRLVQLASGRWSRTAF